MGHHHHHENNYSRAFAIGVALNIGFVVVEAVFGILADSLALLADAGHNLSDVLGLVLAWGAIVLSRRMPTRRRTYGWRSSSIMAALINSLVLITVVGGIIWEALTRLTAPQPIGGWTVIWVALGGLVINSATAMMFASGRKHDLNIRGAFLHMAADAGISAGVAVSGLIIVFTGWLWLDPLVSLAIAAVIFFSTWSLLRESVDLAMHAVPQGIDSGAIENYLAQLPGVDAVHDLHIWALSTTEPALTAHLVKPDPADDDRLIARIMNDLHERFGIEHATIQWERQDCESYCGCYRTDSCGGKFGVTKVN